MAKKKETKSKPKEQAINPNHKDFLNLLKKAVQPKPANCSKFSFSATSTHNS
jgi:hypothetical protein